MPRPTNHLTLAVAGARKTQSIVDDCVAAPAGQRILVLTYTQANQAELRTRLKKRGAIQAQVDVQGWFTFLIGAFVRPFLPFLYPGQRVGGFDFKSEPQRGKTNEDWSKYFNEHGQVRKVHLPQVATRVETASSGAGQRRLSRIYDQIYIDEVQDLCGYDLDVLQLLMAGSTRLRMVGDVRQAILATNDREQRNKQYKFMKIWNWFQDQAAAGRLEIVQQCTTWRCRPEVAALADSLFDDSWGFAPTESKNNVATKHDGIFLVRSSDIDAYIASFRPLVLRNTAASGRSLQHISFVNFGKAKGLGRQRVLILATGPIREWVQSGKPLEAQQAARFYVGVTRAEQSVAIVVDDPGRSTIPYWEPGGSAGILEDVP